MRLKYSLAIIKLMSFNCPDCSHGMVKRSLMSILGFIDGWYCERCGVFYEKKELKRIVLTV
jgi:ribosomal protein L37AE/L43A